MQVARQPQHQHQHVAQDKDSRIIANRSTIESTQTIQTCDNVNAIEEWQMRMNESQRGRPKSQKQHCWTHDKSC